MSTRRKPITTSSSAIIANGTPVSPSNMSQPQKSPHSPLLPTPLEAVLLAIYPGTLVLGSIFSLLSPQTRAAPYDSLSQSHPADSAPSYFAQKKNIFNVYFVKIGWFWTTIALLLFIFTHPFLGPRGRIATLTPRRIQSVLRWGLATLWWGAVTQWFFGPPIIDRGFSLTGGACERLEESDKVQAKEAGRILTHAACRAAGGRWKGGHDISGHVFLLILGSGLLWFEILPVLLKRSKGLMTDRVVQSANGTVGSVSELDAAPTEGPGSTKVEKGDEKVAGFSVKFALGVAGLSWWMLLMTAAYFHTWFEKFTGLLVALIALWTIYFLPRGVPTVRQVVGMPGV
ncbi:hypothetical protein NA57DRAFT_73140 [Rhizodiscina lignyota]|uniref:Acyl-coenzyme A diphosphatase SCS3 n=1 Tax=Rhizodiscina lignyota TaxID=1504668 RepID=A0A9P4INK9_9PEZI|nr:hypothetical protein NA57DRAFT_73140 [Rhizodiscina lignyota]